MSKLAELVLDAYEPGWRRYDDADVRLARMQSALFRATSREWPRSPDDEDVEREWRDFWQPIVMPNGKDLDLRQIKGELYDFSMLLNSVPKVYYAVTEGRITKPNTEPSAVIREFEEFVERQCREAIAEAMDEG